MSGINRALWGDMIVMSVRDPAEVARRLIAMQIPREVLWTGLALAWRRLVMPMLRGRKARSGAA